MKNSFKLFIAITLITTLLSCKKDTEECGVVSTVPIISNGPVIVGYPIEISTNSYDGRYNTWTTPSGKTLEEAGFVSVGNERYRKEVANYADSGLYKVEVFYRSCVQYAGSAIVKVTAPPLPPCSIANNSSTSSVVGVGGNTYPFVYFTNNGSSIAASGGGETLNLRFPNNVKPRNGIHITSGASGPTQSTTEVSCWISSGSYNFANQAGQSIYVNTINGKMQIGFCNNQFTNPLGTSIIRISAKITEP
jgi:hypothetical protein